MRPAHVNQQCSSPPGQMLVMGSVFDVQIATSAPASGMIVSFLKSQLSLKKWVVLMYWWAENYPVTDAACEAEVTEATACAVYQWLREVCTTHLLHTPIRLGGPGIIVQIDESLMSYKPKVN